MSKYIILGSSSDVRHFFAIDNYFSGGTYFVFAEINTGIKNFKPNENTIVNGTKLVISTSKRSTWCSGGVHDSSTITDYVWVQPTSWSTVNTTINKFDDLPKINVSEYEGIIMLHSANRLISFALFDYYEHKLPLIVYEDTITVCKTKEDIVNCENIRRDFRNLMSHYSYSSGFNTGFREIAELVDNNIDTIRTAIKYFADITVEGDTNNELFKMMLAGASISSSSRNYCLNSIISDFLNDYLVPELFDEDYLLSFVNNIHEKFIFKVMEKRISEKNATKNNSRLYLTADSKQPDSVYKLVCEKNMEIFKTRPQTIHELELLFERNAFTYTLSSEQSNAIVKILNRNKANKNLRNIIRQCIEMFSDSLEWDKVDQLILDKFFDNEVKIGKYTFGTKNSDSENKVEPKLTAIARGFSDVPPYLITPSVTMTYVVMAPLDEIKGNIRQLSVDLFSYLSKNYTSTGGTNYELYRSIKSLRNEKDNKLFKDDTLKILLDETFRLVRKDNRKLMYKKFYIMVNSLELDYLCTDKMYTEDKMYKKVKMEAKMGDSK